MAKPRSHNDHPFAKLGGNFFKFTMYVTLVTVEPDKKYDAGVYPQEDNDLTSTAEFDDRPFRQTWIIVFNW